MIECRAAVASDAANIVELVREGFAPDRLALFLYGCDGIATYVRDQIETAHPGTDTRFAVALDEHGAFVGTTEFRVFPDRLFLNYVAVCAAGRRAGIANQLLAAGIESIARPEHATFALDVFEDNVAALAWYRGLGFEIDAATEWWDVPLDLAATPAPPAVIGGYPQCVVLHRRYGFSRFSLTSQARGYEVGLFGTDWFRVTDPHALEDVHLLASLRAIDPRRRILALLPDGALPVACSPGANRRAATLRMRMDLAELRAALAKRLRCSVAPSYTLRDIR